MTSAFVVVGQRGAVALDAGFRVRIEYRHEAVGLGKWQRMEQDRVDHGKNRQIRSEANGEGQKGSGSESGCLSQQSRGVTQLPAQLIKQVNSKCLAAMHFDVVQAAELHPYQAGRFFP